MESQDSEAKELHSLLSRPFLGACGLVLVLAGMVARLYTDSHDRELLEIRRGQEELLAEQKNLKSVLDSRATLQPRTDKLEDAVKDLNNRTRALEERSWGSRR